MKSRFGATEQREVDVPGMEGAATYSEQFKCILDALSKKRITTQEALDLGSLILSGCKIEESYDTKLKLEEIQTMLKARNIL
jgi:hypothetical protein